MADLKLAAVYEKPAAFLDDLGRQMLFYIRVIKSVPRTIRSYGKEIIRLLAEVAAGRISTDEMRRRLTEHYTR